ncbi:hypothetical protein N9Q35_01955, partial [Amylibacter sp.]|nr:hypothetical protein [Amylibacter sp.]
KKAKWEYKMSDNVTDENFDKIHEAIDTTITSLEDAGSDLGDIALCMFVEGANILEQMGLSKEEISSMALDFLSSDEATVEMPVE